MKTTTKSKFTNKFSSSTNNSCACSQCLDYMDEDIRAALFEGEDEEGGFEELDDDFISQARLFSCSTRHTTCFVCSLFCLWIVGLVSS